MDSAAADRPATEQPPKRQKKGEKHQRQQMLQPEEEVAQR
jgi:hypothetical protein